MKTIVEMKFGSHLYGTNTPASDLDLKSVHLPTAEAILLQRVKGTVTSNTKTDNAAKNSADDVDMTSFALQRFLGLAAEGQTVAVDMLFAPEAMWTSNSGLWWSIAANRDRLLTRQSASFVGYCRSQANKYGIRGSRVASARTAMARLHAAVGLGYGAEKLNNIAMDVEELCSQNEHMAVINIPSQAGTDVLHWEVCGRKMPFTSSIKSAHEIMERVVKEYGHRALEAEKNQGVDWKALSHAVRIAQQAVELLTTAHVTFPRPNAEHLIDIKLGRLEYKVVAEEIDQLLIDVEASAKVSTLPEQVDSAWIDALVMKAYGDVVRSDRGLI